MANSPLNSKKQVQPLRVLRIWHAAVVAEYRKKIKAIASYPDVELKLLVPRLWREGGQTVRYQSHPSVDVGFQTITGFVLHPNNIRRYLFLNRLWSLLYHFKPDIVDMEEEPFSAVFIQAIRYARWMHLNSRFIFHSSHNILKPLPDPFRRWEKESLSASSAAIVRNPEAKERLGSLGYRKPIFLTGNGIDLSHFSPGDGSAMRRTLNIRQPRVVGYVGKLRTGKGVLDLLEAICLLPRDVALLLVGEGHLRNEIFKRVQLDERLRDRVVLTGAVDPGQMASYYRVMDVLVLPSRTEQGWKESFGRTLIEAMACGVPVIGSNSGAIPTTVGKAGLIFQEKDSTALAEKIVRLFSQEDLRTSFIEKGIEHCRQFAWHSIAELHHQVYRSLIT